MLNIKNILYLLSNIWPLCLAHAVTNNNKSHVKNSTHKNPKNQKQQKKRTQKGITKKMKVNKAKQEKN